ncbi:unnamed protein product [Prunus armeniaca]|uniref:Uncharacterized protein n=1 Tax=Prunus armeniaca TaxID=36596 RepID=A0A6J5XBA6_PRUAR|nr:unnamed protein product [Prunus armeniaca]
MVVVGKPPKKSIEILSQGLFSTGSGVYNPNFRDGFEVLHNMQPQIKRETKGYALSRDKGIPFSSRWQKLHPKHKVPSDAVWLCAAISILLGLPVLKVNVVFTAITSICTIGWVGGYAVPIFARMVMAKKNFKPRPFYLGKARRPICFVAFLWICYTCSVFLLPTCYTISWDTFNYAPVALSVGLGLIMLWWVLDARK